MIFKSFQKRRNMEQVLKLANVLIIYFITKVIGADNNSTICQQRDTCNEFQDRNYRLVANDFQIRNCFCDEKCAFYKDCCGDSSYIKDVDFSSNPFTCKFTNNFEYTYVYSKCKHDFNIEIIKAKCENISRTNGLDTLIDVPVVDLLNSITYKNIYCAVCNDVDVENLLSWDISFDLSKAILSKLYGENLTRTLESFQYIGTAENEVTWTNLIMELPSKYINTFPKVNITIREPDFNQSVFIRRCKPFLTTTCASDWLDVKVQQLCENNTSYRYETGELGRTFKNKQCAICNNVPIESVSCEDNRFYDFAQVSWVFPLQMTLNYKNIGVVKSLEKECPFGQVYNIEEGKCEPIMCTSSGFIEGTCTVNKEFFLLSL